MRGSTPLDVAAASCIDNNELALALQEQDLEMVNPVPPLTSLNKLQQASLSITSYLHLSMWSSICQDVDF